MSFFLRQSLKFESSETLSSGRRMRLCRKKNDEIDDSVNNKKDMLLVCVCVCEREREREKERAGITSMQ
jgi:hypothetical protein